MATNNTQAVIQQRTPLQIFNGTISNVKTQEFLSQMLGKKKETFVTNLVAVVSNNATLQECTPMSLIYAATRATALDFPLDPNFGFSYLIPYKDNKKGVTLAQLQFGYRAYIQLAMRTGQFRYLNACDIREGELISKDFITGEYVFAETQDRLSKPVIGYQATFILNNGFRKTLYMTKDEMQAHALRYSQTYKSSNKFVKESSKWFTDFDAMALKTVIKLLLSKYAPLSMEMQSAIKLDQAVFSNSNEVEYQDNPENNAPINIEEAVATQRESMRGTTPETQDMP